jgi:threonine dehydratase
MRLLLQRCKQLVEPSSAIALAAVLGHRDHFAGQRVGIVLSGGNLDLDALPTLFAQAARAEVATGE